MRKRIVSMDNVVEFWQTLTDEEKLAHADNSELLKRFLARLAKRATRNTYVVALSDEQAVSLLVENKKYNKKQATSTRHQVAQVRQRRRLHRPGRLEGQGGLHAQVACFARGAVLRQAEVPAGLGPHQRRAHQGLARVLGSSSGGELYEQDHPPDGAAPQGYGEAVQAARSPRHLVREHRAPVRPHHGALQAHG